MNVGSAWEIDGISGVQKWYRPGISTVHPGLTAISRHVETPKRLFGSRKTDRDGLKLASLHEAEVTCSALNTFPATLGHHAVAQVESVYKQLDHKDQFGEPTIARVMEDHGAVQVTAVVEQFEPLYVRHLQRYVPGIAFSDVSAAPVFSSGARKGFDKTLHPLYALQKLALHPHDYAANGPTPLGPDGPSAA